jgi:rhodanese-related sulfurtransferase
MEPRRISVADLKGRLDRGETIAIVDTRAEEAWRKADAQIPGSIRVPPDQVEAHLDEIPRAGLVVTYCT